MRTYKVGDKVKIKSEEWFEEEGRSTAMVYSMKKFCGQEVTISEEYEDGIYHLGEDEEQWFWNENMFEENE